MLPSVECKIKSESTSFKLGQSIFMHLWVFKYTKSFSFLFRSSKGKEYNALYAILQKAIYSQGYWPECKIYQSLFAVYDFVE